MTDVRVPKVSREFSYEDVALLDLIVNVERAFGKSVGNWLTEQDRVATIDLRDRIAALLDVEERAT